MNPSILAEIAALTDRNEHTQARLVLAEHIGAADSVAVLRLIQNLQDTAGYISADAANLRAQITVDLYHKVADTYGPAALKAICAAL